MKSSIVVTVKEGRNLIAKDSNGKSDPYCKVTIPSWPNISKSTTQKTPIVKENLNPVWNSVFSGAIGINSSGLDALVNKGTKVPPILIEIWDRDMIVDDFMGQVEISVTELVIHKETVGWHDVRPRAGKKDKVSGQILVSVKLNEVSFTVEQQKKIAAASHFSVQELKKLEDEFKKGGFDTKQICKQEDLLNYIIKLKLLDPLITRQLHNGQESTGALDALEKKILAELYKDKAFMELVAESIFETLDSDKSGSIDWQELIIGLSVLTRGDKAETARLKFKVIDHDNNGLLDRNEYKEMALKDLRSTFAAMRIGFKIGLRIGIEREAQSKQEAKELTKLFDQLPFEFIFESVENLFTSGEIINSIVTMVFDFADADKNGMLSESEFIRWATDADQQAQFAMKIQEMLLPFLEKLTVDVQEKFVKAVDDYFG